MNYADIKNLVLIHYSRGKTPKCMECNSKIDLQIDHFDENGGCERKKYGSGYNFYRFLIRSKYPKGYGVLCSKCNVIKSLLYHDMCIRSLKKLLFIRPKK